MDGGWEIDKITKCGSYFNIIAQRQELLFFWYNDLVFILVAESGLMDCKSEVYIKHIL